MNFPPERVRTLEQQETGEMRLLRCSACGNYFRSIEQIVRHEMQCRDIRLTERRERRA